jgi:hypothetical protein
MQVMEAGEELFDEGVQRRKDLVAHIVLAWAVPDVFQGVEFGAERGERLEVKGGGNL